MWMFQVGIFLLSLGIWVEVQYFVIMTVFLVLVQCELLAILDVFVSVHQQMSLEGKAEVACLVQFDWCES